MAESFSELGKWRYEGSMVLGRRIYRDGSNFLDEALTRNELGMLTGIDVDGGNTLHEEIRRDRLGNVLAVKYPRPEQVGGEQACGDAFEVDGFDRLIGAKLGIEASDWGKDYGQITQWGDRKLAYALDKVLGRGPGGFLGQPGNPPASQHLQEREIRRDLRLHLGRLEAGPGIQGGRKRRNLHLLSSRVFFDGPGIDEHLGYAYIPDGGTNWTRYTYLLGHQGTVRAVLDASGAVQERYLYDPYGKRRIYTGDWIQRTASQVHNDYGYTGRTHDPAAGLLYYRNRWYHLNLGPFLTYDRNKLGFFQFDGINVDVKDEEE